MNEAGRWRLELAEQMAGLYAQNAKVAAVVVAGSVGHGRFAPRDYHSEGTA